MHVGIATGFANHSQVDDRQFIREELSQLIEAEELGFESMWMTEHHFSDYSISPDPLFYLMWLAAKTKRARLGTQVVVVPWRDPVRLAEQIIMLDHVSDGRAIIGFGRGLARMEYEGLRVPQEEARQRFDEIVAMVMEAMRTGFIEGDGEIFKQPRRELRPHPIRPLDGRAFCAAGSPPSMVAAARLGLGRLYLGQPMVAGHKQGPAKLTDHGADEWLNAWKEAHPGVTPTAPFVSNIVFVDESSERAQEMSRKYSARVFEKAVENYEMTSSHHGQIKGYEAYASMVMTPEQAKEAIDNAWRGSIAGTPQEVLEGLDKVRQLRQPQGLFPHLWTGGMSHDEAVTNMRYFAKTCLDEVKSWKGAPSTIDGEPALAAAE